MLYNKKIPSFRQFWLVARNWPCYICGMIESKGMRPAQPGAIMGGMIQGLREETGQAYTITEIADGLGVHRRTLSLILNHRSGISPEMAVKLSEAFNTSADLWLNLQKKYDLWQAEKKVNRAEVRQFVVSPVVRFKKIV